MYLVQYEYTCTNNTVYARTVEVMWIVDMHTYRYRYIVLCTMYICTMHIHSRRDTYIYMKDYIGYIIYRYIYIYVHRCEIVSESQSALPVH